MGCGSSNPSSKNSGRNSNSFKARGSLTSIDQLASQNQNKLSLGGVPVSVLSSAQRKASSDQNPQTAIKTYPNNLYRFSSDIRIVNQLKRYRKDTIIGRGSFGISMFKGEDTLTARPVGIKFIPLNGCLRDHQPAIAAFKKEITLLKNANHHNILSYYDFYLNDTSNNIGKEQLLRVEAVMQLTEGKTLRDQLKKSDRYFSESQTAFCLIQILSGLEFLDSIGQFHGSLKWENILVDEEGTIKLSDMWNFKRQLHNFISCHTQDDEDYLTEKQLLQMNIDTSPVNWIAPELLDGAPPSIASDVWSIGCLAIELLTGIEPFAASTREATIKQIRNNQPPRFPQRISNECHVFLSKCLQPNPKDRSSISTLLQCSFIQGKEISIVNQPCEADIIKDSSNTLFDSFSGIIEVDEEHDPTIQESNFIPKHTQTYQSIPIMYFHDDQELAKEEEEEVKPSEERRLQEESNKPIEEYCEEDGIINGIIAEMKEQDNNIFQKQNECQEEGEQEKEENMKFERTFKSISLLQQNHPNSTSLTYFSFPPESSVQTITLDRIPLNSQQIESDQSNEGQQHLRNGIASIERILLERTNQTGDSNRNFESNTDRLVEFDRLHLQMVSQRFTIVKSGEKLEVPTNEAQMKNSFFIFEKSFESHPTPYQDSMECQMDPNEQSIFESNPKGTCLKIQLQQEEVKQQSQERNRNDVENSLRSVVTSPQALIDWKQNEIIVSINNNPTGISHNECDRNSTIEQQETIYNDNEVKGSQHVVEVKTDGSMFMESTKEAMPQPRLSAVVLMKSMGDVFGDDFLEEGVTIITLPESNEVKYAINLFQSINPIPSRTSTTQTAKTFPTTSSNASIFKDINETLHTSTNYASSLKVGQAGLQQ